MNDNNDEEKNLDIPNLIILKRLYKSKFSIVWLVRNKMTKNISILKGYNIVKNSDEKSVSHIKSEREFLTLNNCDENNNIMCSKWISPYKDSNNIYLNYTLVEGLEMSKIFQYFNFSNLTIINERDNKFSLYFHIIKNIAENLSRIHNLGFIYRDLKLNNMIISKEFRVSIIDYGLIKKLINNNEKFHEARTTTVCGTYHIMAPEILSILLNEEIKSYNYKIDIYSFGINMFEIFFGKPPFKYIYSYNYDEITEYFIYLKEKKDKEFYNNIFKQMIEELHFEKDSKYYSTLNEIKDLINLCTEYEYEKRPSFEFIIQRLNILINGSYTKIDDLNLKDEYFTDLYEKIVSEGIFDS